MIREIDASVISDKIASMCIEAAHNLSFDMKQALEQACKTENDKLGKLVLNQLLENLEIAKKDMIPICQDTGMCVVYLEIGQDVHIINGNLTKAIDNGVAKGYTFGYLRKSIVNDPILRINTKNNTPAVIHTKIVDGDSIKITICLKGFGSENKSKLYMLKPADGIEGIKKVVIETVKLAGEYACPPMIIGVGIGGTFEKCAELAKEALIRNLSEHSPLKHISDLEIELLTEINKLNIGPAGLGGRNTALSVNIETFPTHIAGLPVAINICCHANRHISQII